MSQSPVNEPPDESEGNNLESSQGSNLESIDFIDAMHTSDEPNTTQPEDVTLLLYLGHMPF